MVKLRRVKTQGGGVSSQLGLLRFSEEGSKGARWDPKAFMLFSFAIAVVLAVLNILA